MQEYECIQSLKTIGAIVKFLDISPFEMTHSELIPALLAFLTANDSSSSGSETAAVPGSSNSNSQTSAEAEEVGADGDSTKVVVDQNEVSSTGKGERERKRLRGASSGKGLEIKVAGECGKDSAAGQRLPPRANRMRIFAHVFLGCSVSSLESLFS
jgi:hypothetical protein